MLQTEGNKLCQVGQNGEKAINFGRVVKNPFVNEVGENLPKKGNVLRHFCQDVNHSF